MANRDVPSAWCGVEQCYSYFQQSDNLPDPSTIKHIAGDGNCFFRCINYCVTGSENFHLELRQMVVSHMEANSNTGNSIGRYCVPHGYMKQYIRTSNIYGEGIWAT